MKKLNRKGFTIVELVIVIAVIGVLAAVLIPTFTKMIRKSQVSTDTQLIRNLNTALEADKVESKHVTMTQALQSAKDYGYDISKINASRTNNEIVWDSDNDVFCYVNEGKLEYLPDSVDNNKKLKADSYKLWKIYADAPKAGENFSIYVAGQGAANYVNTNDVNVGVDCGDYTIQNVSYQNDGANRDVVIRTNSNLTSLTINAPSDKVYHYDSVGNVNIISSDMASYHENGTVSFLEVAGGHVVLEETAKVSAVHFTATNGEFKNSDNKTISIDLSKVSEENMPDFSRDPVTIPDDGAYVAEVTTDKTEYVWLFGNGIKEQMVTTEQEGSIAENGSLKSGITAGAEDGSVAEQIANPAKRNSDGALVDNNGDEIDVSSVNWSNSDALEPITDIVYEELKTKEDAINENVSTLILTMAQLHDYITGTVVNGVIGADIEVTEVMELGSDKVMDLNGYTLSVNLSSGRPFVFSNHQSMTVNANGGKMNITNSTTNGLFRIQSPGSRLVLNGGTYTGYTPDASAIIWIGKNGNSLTYAVYVELNDVTANCIGQFVRDGSWNVYYNSYKGFTYKSYGLTPNKLVVNGGNYTFNNLGINVNGSISGFVLQSMESEFNGVTATSAIGSIMEIDNGVATFKNNNFVVQNANNIQGWNATTIGVAFEANITIESGNYSGYYGVSVFTSGGHITVRGGTISGTSHAFDLYDDDNRSENNQTTTLDIYAGTINGDIYKEGTEAVITDHR